MLRVKILSMVYGEESESCPKRLKCIKCIKIFVFLKSTHFVRVYSRVSKKKVICIMQIKYMVHFLHFYKINSETNWNACLRWFCRRE